MSQKMSRCVFTLALGGATAAACAGAPAGAPDDEAATSQAGTVCQASAFGALPDDGIDDLVPLRNAMASCSTVVLAAGTYQIATPSAKNRPAAILAMPANVELVGVGDASVIAFTGDALLRDWHGIHLGDHAIVHHLKIDTAGLTNTDEQTHAIRGDGPLASPLVEYVTFNHPQRGFDGGDCIQLVGYPEREILGPVIRNNNFAVCDRSGVAIHSGVRGGQIANNVFSNTGDQDIDGEGTGDVDGLEIGPGNTFATGAGAQSSISLELQLASHIHVHHNAFNGRGLFVYGCTSCEFDHDSITQNKATSGGVLEVQKDASDIHIHDETIVRAASAGAGAVLRFMPHGSGTPRDLTVANNRLIQNTGGSTVDAGGIVGLHVTGNELHYNGPAVTTFAVSALGSAGTAPIRTTDITLADNLFFGGFFAVLRLSGSYGGAGTASLTGNHADGAATYSVYCENINTGSQVLGPITYVGNTLPAPQCGSLVTP